MLTKREEYIRTFFIPSLKKEGVTYMSDSEVDSIVKKISDIGNKLGFIGVNVSQNSQKADKRRHKYDVWIAKEVKKNQDIIYRTIDLRLIVDWASETKADLFSYDFDSAFKEQSVWHRSMLLKYKIEDIAIPELDKERIAFRFSDKQHFLYILSAGDLKYEGQIMGHCVGGGNYRATVKNKTSLILSLRDIANEPHVTIQIDVKTSSVVQQYGKGNKEPIPKYLNLLKEFVLYASNFSGLENTETLKFLNLHLV